MNGELFTYSHKDPVVYSCVCLSEEIARTGTKIPHLEKKRKCEGGFSLCDVQTESLRELFTAENRFSTESRKIEMWIDLTLFSNINCLIEIPIDRNSNHFRKKSKFGIKV